MQSGKKFAKASLMWLDRFGEVENPIPKGVATGLLSVLVYGFVIVYGTLTYLKFQNMPPVQKSSVLWAQTSGPFPLPLRCAAEDCWLSSRFNLEAGEKCLAALPEGQSSRCRHLRKGEMINISVCYASLPSTGLRLHYAGRTHWEALLPTSGLNDEQDGQVCGWYAESDSLGANGSVTTMPSVLCSGLATAYYVRTMNTSAKGTGGGLRHEWFAKQLSASAPLGDFQLDPCQPLLPQGSVSTVLRMDPDFSEVSVLPPASFLTTLLGIVGGALASCDEVVEAIIFLLLSTLSIKHLCLGESGHAAAAEEDKAAAPSAVAVAPAEPAPQTSSWRLVEKKAETPLPVWFIEKRVTEAL